MDNRTYIALAAKTAIYDFAPTRERLADDRTMALLHYAVGLAGEVFEWIDGDNSIEEIGDLWWYTAGIIRVWQAIEYFDGDLLADIELSVGSVIISSNYTETIQCATESIVDAVKAYVFYGKPIAPDEFQWSLVELFLALSCIDATGLAREANIAKLKARYGEKFSENMAINRDLGDEQEAMEAI